MGAMKRFAEERRERSAPIAVSTGAALTWAEVNALTDGRIGTFTIPCPYCGAGKFSSRRFRIERPSLGIAKWHCFYCGESGELRKETVDDPLETQAQREAVQKRTEEAQAKTARALAMWNEAVPITGTPVINYLAARGIRDLPPNVDGVLRYHSHCLFGFTRRRVMLGLFRDIRSDAPVAVQRTAITDNGRNVERRTLGPNARAAIKLWPREGKTLVIGEGIETTLAAALYLTRGDGRELKPAWATTVANNILYFPVLNWVRRLVILVDNDESRTGQRAAQVCAERWSRSGREVVLMKPNSVKDFNDLIKG